MSKRTKGRSNQKEAVMRWNEKNFIRLERMREKRDKRDKGEHKNEISKEASDH